MSLGEFLMYNPYNWTIKFDKEDEDHEEKMRKEYNELVEHRQALMELIFNLEEEIEMYQCELEMVNQAIDNKMKKI